MPENFSVHIGQFAPVLGGISENAQKARALYDEAKTEEANFELLPELFLTGYSVKDLFLRPAFLRDVEQALQELVEYCQDETILGIGAPLWRGNRLYNGYIYIGKGQILHEVYKQYLPNYDVFDEMRWFTPGGASENFSTPHIGTAICADIWENQFAQEMKTLNPDFVIVPNGSPYYSGKIYERHEMAKRQAKAMNAPLIYLHRVGVEDEMVFDGASFIALPDGEICAQMPSFEECSLRVEFELQQGQWQAKSDNLAALKTPLESQDAQDYRAMVEALRGYMQATGFEKAILGLSGGIDSALVAAIAVDALGASNVSALMLPSEFTASSSLDDAQDCARRLGIALDELPIAPAMAIAHESLAKIGQTSAGLTAENIQPRLRAMYLMALSNHSGALLLTTGNKSEVACGYSTLYGDMAGGYNPIKDIYKTRVFALSHWRNHHHFPFMKGAEGKVIPQNIIDKPPSAELRPDQKDSDSLPDYAILDHILEGLIENRESVQEIVNRGFDQNIVEKVQKLIFLSEYKRFQSAPGPKISKCHLGTDRRYPIMNAWRDG